MMDLNEILLAVEFGYIQHEKGHNLQYALEEAKKVMRPSIERDFLEAVKTGHQNALTLWAREYDIRIPTGGNWKDRVRFATEQIKLRSNTMADKKTTKTTNPAAKETAKPEITKKKAEEKPAGPPMLGTKDIAEKLGIEGTTLRRFLRAKGIEKNEGRYAWKEGSKEAAALLKQYAEYAKEQEEKTAEAAKPKADKKKAKAGKKSKKKDADEDEGLDDEGGEDEETEEL